MKKWILCAVLGAIGFIACKKETAQCTYTAPTGAATAAESDSIQRFITANGIVGAVKHPSGVYYVVTSQGTGVTPTVCSYLTVAYQGYTFAGAKFDGTAPGEVTSFSLGQLIKGWQFVLPLVKSGSSVTLYIPPSLGYGSEAVRDQNNNIVIAASSYLKFDITLQQVQ